MIIIVILVIVIIIDIVVILSCTVSEGQHFNHDSNQQSLRQWSV